MLVAGGLFVRTLANLESVDLGFNRENLLLFQMNGFKAGHKNPEMAAFYGDLRTRFSQIPGVRQASLSDESLINAGWGQNLTWPASSNPWVLALMAVGPAFFATMQIPLLAGRDIERARPARIDARGRGQPALCEIELRRSRSARPALYLSRRRTADHPNRDMLIVGVARDVVYGGLKEEIPPVVYLPTTRASRSRRKWCSSCEPRAIRWPM